jgi:membrane dipeptidase
MDELLLRALELHARYPVVDTHSHFLIAGHYLRKRLGKRHRPPWLWNPLRNVTDLPRLREGRVSCPTFTVYVPIPPFRLSAWKACVRILDTMDRQLKVNQEFVRKVDTARAVRETHAEGRIAVLPAVEGGNVIGKHVERLSTLRSRGVRLFTLTHFIANRICDAAWGPQVHGGVSAFGREVIAGC